MKILALEIELPGTNKDAFQEVAGDEAAKLWKLHQLGVIRELYYRKERSEAVLVLECQGAEEAARILAQLPMVEAGLIDFEIIPLVPYLGFARLFAPQDDPQG